MLKLGLTTYELDPDASENNALYFWKDANGNCAWSIECHYKTKEIKGIDFSPSIELGYIFTSVKSPSDLIGARFSVKTEDDCDEREDMFYITESAPLKKYKIKITSINGGMATVSFSGTAFDDVDSDKPKKVSFKLEETLSIKDMESTDDLSGKDFEFVIDPAKEKRKVNFIPNGPANESDIIAYENKYGCKFPDDYRKFLLENNGGLPDEKENFIIIPAIKSDKLKVLRFLWITENTVDRNSDHSLSEFAEEYGYIYDPTKYIYFVQIYGYNHVVLSIEPGNEGVFVYDWIRNLKESSKKHYMHKICDTFTEFLDLVVVDE